MTSTLINLQGFFLAVKLFLLFDFLIKNKVKTLIQHSLSIKQTLYFYPPVIPIV